MYKIFGFILNSNRLVICSPHYSPPSDNVRKVNKFLYVVLICLKKFLRYSCRSSSTGRDDCPWELIVGIS